MCFTYCNYSRLAIIAPHYSAASHYVSIALGHFFDFSFILVWILKLLIAVWVCITLMVEGLVLLFALPSDQDVVIGLRFFHLSCMDFSVCKQTSHQPQSLSHHQQCYTTAELI